MKGRIGSLVVLGAVLSPLDPSLAEDLRFGAARMIDTIAPGLRVAHPRPPHLARSLSEPDQDLADRFRTETVSVPRPTGTVWTILVPRRLPDTATFDRRSRTIGQDPRSGTNETDP